MFVNEDILARGKADDALFAFFHCQRTGGSNLLRWFNTVFTPEAVFSNNTSPDYVRWEQTEDPKVLNGKKLVGGFSNFRRKEISRPLICLSVVRHPFYRTTSLFRLAKIKKDHFAHDLSGLSFEEFYREASKRKPGYFHNLACLRVSNSTRSADAIASLEQNFGLVGTTNAIAEMTAFLCKYYNWNVSPMAPGKNETDEVHYKSLASSPVFDEIMHKNQDDYRLFRYVVDGSAGVTKNIAETGAAAAAAPLVEKKAEEQNAATSPSPNASAVFEGQDSDFFEYKKDHPEATYARYQMEKVATKLHQGDGHHSLGARIVNRKGVEQDFWQAGAPKARKFLRNYDVTPDQKVVEYGCGSLRIGAHFIKFLNSKKFYGVDVTDQFYEIGKGLIGADIVQEKEPRFDVISNETVEKLAEFRADFIYSSSVCCHVHPEEIGFYFNALTKAASKPGAVVVFDATLADEPVRYRHRSWAWPLEYLKNAMPELQFADATKPNHQVKDGFAISLSTLKFVRA